MKKKLAWIYRIVCITVILTAAVTLIRCLLHINDDHSREALLGAVPVTEQSAEMDQTVSDVLARAEAESDADENPTVVLYDNGSITVNHPYTTVIAAFSDITNSVVAELVWYVDGEEISRASQQLLVDGATANCKVEIDPTEDGADTADVSLNIIFGEKTISGETTVEIERLGSEGSIVIQTEEIPATAKRDTTIYSDKDLSDVLASMAKGDSGLMLDYSTDNSGLKALRIQLENGEDGWVPAEDMEISQEDCTTDEDYSPEVKERFVNSMNYSSDTRYLVWVSLYTQTVNIFTGYDGAWELEKSFDCSTGANHTPTTTGIYTYNEKKDRWDLGTTYVEPVLIYNGGEAFTSLPYSTRTQEIEENTIGKPASGGSVRLLEEDIAWMAENLTVGTMVVVY